MNRDTNRPEYTFSRRTMLRGLGVSMALPWMESLRVWGDEPAGRAVASRPPGAVRLPLLGQRVPQQGMVGQRRGPGHGAGQGARAA